MKKQTIPDERVAAQRRKINSEAYGILMIALMVSLLVQQFLLKAPFQQYAVEFFCFFGMSLYMVIRYLTLGLNLYGERKGFPLLPSMVIGITVAATNGILNYMHYAEHYQEAGMGYFYAVLGITFVSATACAFAALSFVYYLNRKKQAKISKQLDEDEKSE